MDSAWPEPALGNLETTAFAQQHIAGRHPYIVVMNFGMAVGGMVVAKHVQRADHLHAGSVQGHQDHGLLFVFLGVRIGLAHDNGDL